MSPPYGLKLGAESQKGKRTNQNKSTDTIITQAVKPEGHHKPTPAQRRKYKNKFIPPVDDNEEAEPSQPAEESTPEIITESLSLEGLHNLRKDLTQ